MVTAGVLSYSLYLWHWPILSLASNVTMRSASWQVLLGCVMLTVVLSVLTLKFVENPVRYGNVFRLAGHRLVLGNSAAALAGTAMLGGGLLWVDSGDPANSRDRLSMAIAQDRPDDAYYDCTYVREYWDGKLSVDDCRFGAEGESVQWLLWGDSHALAWAPLMQALQRDGSPAFTQLSVTGCQPLDPAELRYPLWACAYYRYHDLSLCGVSRAEHEQASGEHRQVIKRVAGAFDSVRVIDPVEHFCIATECPAFWRDQPVLWDDNHLSASAAQSLARTIEPEFRCLMSE